MIQDWIMALIGGGLIGLAATVLLLVSGKVAGISGILFGTLHREIGDWAWRAWFLLGLLGGGVLARFLVADPFENDSGVSLPLVAVAGVLVGFGTRLGGGCTSGHGVCGISRMSIRSIVATLTFMAAGIATVAVLGMVGGVK